MFFAKFPYVNYDHLAGTSTDDTQHGASSSALAITGKDINIGSGVYWPCYRTSREAIDASPRPDLIREGESTRGYHVITIQNVDFYMSNGLIEGTNQLHAAAATTYQELVDRPSNPSEDGAKLATNIMRRFRFRRSVVSNKIFFYKIDVSDTDRPDILAHKFYGDPQLHWVILMANDIRDPYNDWPRTQHSLEKKVAKVYPGSSLFLYTTSMLAQGYEYAVDGVDVVPTTTSIPTSRTFTRGDVIESHLTGKRASVHSWDPTYSRLILVGPEAHLFPDLEYIHNITTGKTRIGFGVKFVADSTQAIHHWEDELGIPVNPLELDRSTAADQNDPVGTATRFYRDAYILNETSISLSEMTVPKHLTVVTNEQHEVAENDKKRKIKIIRPEYVPALTAELKSVFEQ